MQSVVVGFCLLLILCYVNCGVPLANWMGPVDMQGERNKVLGPAVSKALSVTNSVNIAIHLSLTNIEDVVKISNSKNVTFTNLFVRYLTAKYNCLQVDKASSVNLAFARFVNCDELSLFPLNITSAQILNPFPYTKSVVSGSCPAKCCGQAESALSPGQVSVCKPADSVDCSSEEGTGVCNSVVVNGVSSCECIYQTTRARYYSTLVCPRGSSLKVTKTPYVDVFKLSC